MKLALIGLMVSSLAFGQDTGNYLVQYSGSLSASTQAITVHLPTSETRSRIRFGKALIYSSAACDWRTERDGTAPTTTTLASVKLNSFEPTAVFTAFRSSNVGTAARVHTTIDQLASWIVIDLGSQDLKPGDNLTIRTPSNCTANYTVSIEVKQFTF